MGYASAPLYAVRVARTGAEGVAEQPRKQGPVEQRCGQEFDFLQRWRELVDKVGGEGGKARVARRLKWSTSTVSRDYAGITLPSDEHGKGKII